MQVGSRWGVGGELVPINIKKIYKAHIESGAAANNI